MQKCYVYGGVVHVHNVDSDHDDDDSVDDKVPPCAEGLSCGAPEAWLMLMMTIIMSMVMKMMMKGMTRKMMIRMLMMINLC